MTDGTYSRAGNERLARIAELVGRPVEALRVPGGDPLSDALELIKLWERTDASGRARLLACARAEASRVGEPQRASHEQTGHEQSCPAIAGFRGTLR